MQMASSSSSAAAASSSLSAAASSSSSGTRRRSNTVAEVLWRSDEHLCTYLLRNRRGFTAKAIFKQKELIRGGIPICFSESFNHHETVRPDMRAFASKYLWRVDEESTPFQTSANNDGPFIDLILTSSPEFYFPHKNINTNGKHFKVTFAYHNYLSVSYLREVRVEGLGTLHYLDYLQNKKLYTEQQDASTTYESEVDRLYVSTNHRVTVMDHHHSKMQSIVIHSDDGLPDIVVWNPWDKKAKTITNFDKDEYKYMLCVGPACVENPIKLNPGQEWTGTQELMAKKCIPSI